jgi:hypothetical protein
VSTKFYVKERTLGRLRCKWENTIKTDRKPAEYKEVEWINQIRDKVKQGLL